MNKRMILASAIAFAAAASAAHAGSVSGPGGTIPSAGTGGGGTWPTGGMATALPTAPSTFSISVPEGVASVTSIAFTSLAHTFIGDLQCVLIAPGGAMHNIFVRPALFNPSINGSPANFLGDYSFVESGAANSLPTASGAPGTAVNIVGGGYNQTFAGSPAAGATWVSGNLGIANTPMSSISGAAGTWSIRFYDWVGADTGSLGTWTLNYAAVPAPGAMALLGLAGVLGRVGGGSRRRRV